MTGTVGVEKVRTDDGVSIAYQTSGTGPLTMVALHGWGGAGSGHSWREVIRHLDCGPQKLNPGALRLTKSQLLGERACDIVTDVTET